MDNAAAALPVLLGALNEARISASSISIQQPDLEAVFFDLTGHPLGDSAT